MKDLKEEVVDSDEIINIVDKMKKLNKEDRHVNDPLKDLKKDYPHKIIELDEAILNYMAENALNVLKQDFPDQWKYLTKTLAYPYELLNCIEDYQKPVDIQRNKSSSAN